MDKDGSDSANRTADGLDRVILGLWPDMPEDQLALWAGLTNATKERAISRLEALRGLAGVGGAKPLHAGMADAAAAADTAPSTFYAIAKRWRSAPSLEALGVRVGNEGPGMAAASAFRARSVDEVRRMLGEDSGLTNAEIRRRLGEGRGKLPSFATVKRLVQDAQRVAPPGMPFGASVIMDAAGLDVFYDEGIATRLYAVVDAGTALVLGWDVWSTDDPAGGYARAAHHALFGTRSPKVDADDPPTGLPHLALDGVPAIVPEALEVRLLPGDVDRLSALFQVTDGVRVVRDASLGRAVVDAVGERLGSVWIGTGSREAGRSYRTGRIEDMPILTERLRKRIGDALREHDHRRLEKIPRDAGRGPPAAALASLRTLLLPVSKDADIHGLADR